MVCVGDEVGEAVMGILNVEDKAEILGTSYCRYCKNVDILRDIVGNFNKRISYNNSAVFTSFINGCFLLEPHVTDKLK